MADTAIEWTDVVWNPVPGWIGFFVTGDGRIKGPSGRILRPMKGNRGHLYVTRGRLSKKLYVHRAVLLAFSGPPGPGQEARHLNGVKEDNRIENLVWGNLHEQRADDRRNGVLRTHGRRLSPEVVAQVRASTESSRILAFRHGVSHTTIQKLRRGERYG